MPDYSGASSPTSSAPITGQAGELDNRLDLSVGEFPDIKDWEDGKRYRVTMDIEQVSPGKFEALRMLKGDEINADETESSDETPSAKSEQASADQTQDESPQYGNPAVADLMRGMRGGGS